MSDRYIKCYQCGRFSSEDHSVNLKGVSNYKGDILLPSNLMQKDFCSKQCFWEYVKEQTK